VTIGLRLWEPEQISDEQELRLSDEIESSCLAVLVV